MASSATESDFRNHPELSTNSESAPMTSMKEGFFDFKKPGWKLVIVDLALGIPASLLISFAVKYMLRLIFAGFQYYDLSSLLFGDDDIKLNLNYTVITSGTASLIPAGLGGAGEEAWKQWERLLCGLTFAIVNSVFVLVWALQIEEMGVAKMVKGERIRRLKEERRAWEAEVSRLETILKAIKMEKSLTPKMQRSSQVIDADTCIKRENVDFLAARIHTRLEDPVYAQMLEEQRRRSDGVPPESLPATPTLGGDGVGGFVSGAGVAK